MELQPWHIWTVAGVVLWIAELFTSGFVLAIFGTACWASAVASAKDLDLKMQLLVFGAASAVLALGIRPIVMRYLASQTQDAETNVEALVGMAGRVTERIGSPEPGRVRVGSEEWAAVGDSGDSFEPGSAVEVVRVEGCTLIVSAARGVRS